MENIKSEDKFLTRINGKENPIVSSRLPSAFCKAPSRPKTRHKAKQKSQSKPVEQHFKKLNSITQDELSRFEEQEEYKKVSKMLTPINVDSKRKAKMEKVLNKIMQGLPDFSFVPGKRDNKNLNSKHRNSQQELKTLQSSNIQLNQMITLSVLKSGFSGVVKKVLHGPSLRMYAIKEVPLHTRESRSQIRDWLCF